MVNLRIFCVNGRHFLTSCSTFGSQVKTRSDVERKTWSTSSIIIILRKIGYATKKGSVHFADPWSMAYPNAWTRSMDYLNGLPLMDHPKIYGKHKFNDAGTCTKDAFDWEAQLWNTFDLRDLTTLTKRCDQSEQLWFNSQTFPTLAYGPLSQNVRFEQVFLLLPTW